MMCDFYDGYHFRLFRGSTAPLGTLEKHPRGHKHVRSQMGSTQGQMGSPQGQMGSPQSQMGSPHSQMGSPQDQMGSPQSQIGSPHGQMGSPQGQMGSHALGNYAEKSDPMASFHLLF